MDQQSSLSVRLSQALLFVPGAFYGYPWKPLVNLVGGSSYDHGYAHFRQQHRCSLNLALHIVALCYGLLANFCLLDVIDGFLPQIPHTAWLRWFSLLTALTWSVCLLCTPAPMVCSALSVASVAAAYLLAPCLVRGDPGLLPGAYVEPCSYGFGFLLVLGAACSRTEKRPGAAAFLSFGSLAVAFGCTTALWAGGPFPHANLELALTLASSGLLLLMALLLQRPAVPVIVGGFLLGRLAAVLTGSAWLFWFSCAGSANIIQGLAHAASKEEATLLKLESVHPGSAVNYEWAHVVFFPNLLLHAIHSNFTGSEPDYFVLGGEATEER